MSDTENVVGPSASRTDDHDASGPRPRYKSWRKKYRKMKAHFDDIMKDNSTMFKEEQKLDALSKRLQEQNDQLLDLLFELNGSFKIPTQLRYNVVPLEPGTDFDRIGLEEANLVLQDAHRAAQVGTYGMSEFAEFREGLERKLANREVKTLTELERTIPHPTYDPDKDDIPSHLADIAVQSGFLDSTHEDAYLLRMDAKLGDPEAQCVPRPVSPVGLTSMTPREVEREVELRNPISVHNWLKKHNVNISLEPDAASEAGGPPTTGKKSRNLAKKVGDRSVQQAKGREEGSPMSAVAGKETDDDMEFADDTPGSIGKVKRPRDDDHAYRPKGGRTGKQKRKREEGDTPSSKKKPRTSITGVDV